MRVTLPATRVTLLVLLALGGLALSACGSDDESGAPATPTTTAPTTTAPDVTPSDPDDDPGTDAPAARVPDREPDVVGVVAAMDGASGPSARLAPDSASDSYYEQMGLLSGDPMIVDADSGAPLTASDVVDGAEVEVWVTGGCMESFPVQCTIEALRVSVPSS
jgi:hypothetical protein